MTSDYTTRCPYCGARLVVVDRYPPVVYNKDGQPAAEQPRPYDPDWVIARHIARSHKH